MQQLVNKTLTTSRVDWVGRDNPLTWIAIGDPQYTSGTPLYTTQNATQIGVIHDIIGEQFPVGGKFVRTPIACMVLGDMVDNASGNDTEYNDYISHYGDNGLLKYPKVQWLGNHDSAAIRNYILARQKKFSQHWYWHPIHFICMNIYPDATQLPWLTAELASIGTKAPVVMCFHYGLDSFAFEYEPPWWTYAEAANYKAVIDGYNIIAHIHGHTHQGIKYIPDLTAGGGVVWTGYTTFGTGSAANANDYNESFWIFQLEKDEFLAAEYVWGEDPMHWQDTHEAIITFD